MIKSLAFTLLLIGACCAQQFPLKAVSIMNGVVMSDMAKQQMQRMMANPQMQQQGGMPRGITFIMGTVHFLQETRHSPLKVSVNITFTPPSMGKRLRGLHVHEFGISKASDNIAEVCGSTGGHYNPTGVPHAAMNAPVHHVGDFGNVVEVNGQIQTQFVAKAPKLFGAHNIVGRTVVLHANADDLGLGSSPSSKSNGNAGPRIACGSIVYLK